MTRRGHTSRALRWIALHFGLSVATVLGAAALVLSMLWLAPGDAIDTLPNGEALRPMLMAEWGLDQPLPIRYFRWLSRALRGDLGSSLTVRPGAPVADLILEPALRSMGWAFSALLLTMSLGTALAWVSAGRSWLRAVVHAISLTPLFLLAHLLVSGLNEGAWWAIQAGTIDRPQWFALPDQDSWLRTLLAIGLLAIGSGALADVHGEVEHLIERLRSSTFVDAARARGMPVWPHIVRNLAPPLIGVAVSRTAFIAGGLIILEKVLLLHGIGSLLWEAASLRDVNLALGITVVLAGAVAAARWLGETLRTVIDPRLGTDR